MRRWPRDEGAGRVDATSLLQPAAVRRLPSSENQVWCLMAQVGLRCWRSTTAIMQVISGGLRPPYVPVCPLTVCLPPAQLFGADPGQAGRRASREPSILQPEESLEGSIGALASPPGSPGCRDGRGVRRDAGWLTGPPQRPVGLLARRTVRPLPLAQADELGRDRCVRFELCALLHCALDDSRVAWCECGLEVSVCVAALAGSARPSGESWSELSPRVVSCD